MGDEKIMDAHLENKQKRIDFLMKNFPSVDPETAQRFIMARTNYEMDEALEKLMKHGIVSIKVSEEPVPHIERNKNDARLIEIKNVESSGDTLPTDKV